MNGAIIQRGHARRRIFAGAAYDSRAGRARAALLRAAGRARRRLRLRGAGGGRRCGGGVVVAPDAAAPGCANLTVIAVADPRRRWAIWRARCAPISGATSSASPDRTARPPTKELIAAALRPLGDVLRTPGSLNTDVGLPLTILSARGDEAFWVLEMAMRGRGEIALPGRHRAARHDRRHHQRRGRAPRAAGLDRRGRARQGRAVRRAAALRASPCCPPTTRSSRRRPTPLAPSAAHASAARAPGTCACST